MAASFSARLLTIAACLASSTVAQLTGNLTYDGAETIQLVIENDSQTNFTIPGTNTMFDQQNQMAYAPIRVTTLSGEPVTLNGSEYRPPTFSDEIFQGIPPGGSYTRNLNMSEYLLGGGMANGPLTTALTKLECFIATLPSKVYALNITTDGPALYFTKGLMAVSIESLPLHFNFTVPMSFDPDQAATIADDSNVRQLAAQTSAANNTIDTRGRFRRHR